MVKQTFITLIFLVLLLALSSCTLPFSRSGQPPASTASPTPAPANSGIGSSGTVIVGGEKTEDGRMVGGYAGGRLGDTLVNEFFSFSVNKAELTSTYAGKSAADGFIFLVAELTVKNVYGDTIPMWSSDFQAQWGEDDEDFGFPIEKTTDEQMDDEYDMLKWQTITKTVVYEVPIFSGEHEYSISYLETYEDDMEGNVFFIYFNLSTPM